mmetsp:Transcript_26657/g.39433  ORF Transcript_26657/g.39433 Transcript_26657/m.39433 type:complete len:1504 (-) Transcript_26657:138-4649(-)
MKNLVLLSETRHSVPNIEHEHEHDYIQCIVSNPNVDHDDPDDFYYDGAGGDGNGNGGNSAAKTPFHYILSPSGRLSGLSSKDVVIWTIDLQQLADEDNEDQQEHDESPSSSKNWFHLSYEENSDCLIALSHGGTIVSIPANYSESSDADADTDTNAPELIGCFDHGITSAEWSADAELLALVTFQEIDDETVDNGIDGDSSPGVLLPVLMTMNTQFEILSETTLPAHKMDESISICWNQKTDSALIAICSHDDEDNTRKIRIFQGTTLEHVALSRTEDGSGKMIPNILGGYDVSWAGANTSNLLACVTRKGRKNRHVIFLEQNGLQHGGFKLEQRLEGEEVVGMTWNASSDILALTLIGKNKDLDPDHGHGSNGEYGKVQFYHRNNYHWYCKYELSYGVGTTVSQVQFDSIQGYHVSITLKNCASCMKEWREYRFIWDTSTASSAGTAAVIDGHHVNLTMFQKAMIPPPMYASRISFGAGTKVVGLCHIPAYLIDNSIDLIVHLNSGELVFCDTSLDNSVVASVNLNHVLSDELDHLDASCLRQVHVVDLKREGEIDGDQCTLLKIVAAACSKASTSFNGPSIADELVYFTICIRDTSTSTSVEVLGTGNIVLEGKVLRLTTWSNSNDESVNDCFIDTLSHANGGALIELVDGTLLQFRSIWAGMNGLEDEGKIFPCDTLLLEPCPWIAGLCCEDGKHLIVGLSSRFRLYYGERQLSDAASSFMMTPTHEFLAYVTLGSISQIRFLPLKTLLDLDLLCGSEDNLHLLTEGYEPRNVERGSTLVSISPIMPKVVLQLPRGNLEGIHPRALVLPHIMALIDRRKFDIALDMMRRQKVDMNLIVDMSPTECLDGGGLRTMVEQVENMNHLNLFIASLTNYNITEWKYPIPSWLLRAQHEVERDMANEEEISYSKQKTFDFSTKVNKVCSKLRLEMIASDGKIPHKKGKFLLPILSTFAKENPPQLESALDLIRKDAIESATELQLSKKRSILLGDQAQGSIKYLAFLAEYVLLFNTALGMYDFELAKAVARNSQMDPKEYLPMLKHLRNLPEFEAKFEVDVKLKRYESALTHLYKFGVSEFDGESKFKKFSEGHFRRCKHFIEEHKLHKLGLELFVHYPQWHNEIICSLGEQLFKENKAQLSLSIFLAARPKYLDGAKRSAKACGDYKTFFACLNGEMTKEEKYEVAINVAKDVSSGKGGLLGRREGLEAGARILLDYCGDVYGAIEMVISAEMWFEARRLALLHSAEDMQSFIVDEAVTYAKNCIQDFESRLDKFVEANRRYGKVVLIRKEARRSGVDAIDDGQNDETGSLFSLASNASNTSIRSNMSGSSVGSLASVSSVISAGAASSFSLVNNQDVVKHKSKFNNIGRKKKKKKATRRERIGTKPGSEEELQNLVWTLQSNVIDSTYASIITETAQFLCQVDQLGVAIELYHAYCSFEESVITHRNDRIENETRNREEEEVKARKEGQFYEKVKLECEEQIDKLCCTHLPQLLHDIFVFTLER